MKKLIYSHKTNRISNKNKKFNLQANNHFDFNSYHQNQAEFFMGGRSLIRNKGLIGKTARTGLRGYRMGKGFASKTGSALIRDRGLIGKASRFGAKNINKGYQAGKNLIKSASPAIGNKLGRGYGYATEAASKRYQAGKQWLNNRRNN